MDIICKCGHDVEQHSPLKTYGCLADSGLQHLCLCDLSKVEVLLIHITEQQVRLDTNRQQVGRMIKEKEHLRNVIVELRGAFHRIIGNVNNSEIVLMICDKVLRIIDNV